VSGLTVVLPLIDKVLPLRDMREQVVSFPQQPVITASGLARPAGSYAKGAIAS
jgi:hypothetical protein